MITPSAVPRLAPGVRLHEDTTRARTVLMGPERMFVPDDTGLAVLRLVDGARCVTDIADLLAAEYNAPRAEILADVQELLADLRQRGAIAA